jgi:hypothetical protein
MSDASSLSIQLGIQKPAGPIINFLLAAEAAMRTRVSAFPFN